MAASIRREAEQRAVRLFFFIVRRHHRFIIFIVITFFIDCGELERIAGNNFQVRTALVALDDFTFFDIIHIDIERIVTFRANY